MKVRKSIGGMACVLLVTSGLTSACTRAQAKVSPPDPALDVPRAPSRVIAAISPGVPQTVGDPPVVPSGTGLDRSEPPRGSTGTAARKVEATTRPTDTAKPDTPEVTDLPRPADEPRAPTSPLTTTTSQREIEVEAGIRADVQRATANLNRVDYQRLSSDARTQYDLAKGYLQQVEENLRGKNFSLAKTLAEKAVALAAQLGR
jgi:hypothetical protein